MAKIIVISDSSDSNWSDDSGARGMFVCKCTVRGEKKKKKIQCITERTSDKNRRVIE